MISTDEIPHENSEPHAKPTSVRWPMHAAIIALAGCASAIGTYAGRAGEVRVVLYAAFAIIVALLLIASLPLLEGLGEGRQRLITPMALLALGIAGLLFMSVIPTSGLSSREWWAPVSATFTAIVWIFARASHRSE